MSESRTARVLRALQEFFGEFMPAYAEGCAPDGAILPYITYQMIAPDVLGEAAFSARVWFSGRWYGEIAAAVDAIGDAIGPGRALPTGSGGAVWLYKAEKFAQFMPVGGDARVKCAYLSMKLVALTD